MQDKTPRLELKDLECHFDGVPAVNGVSLTLEPGQVTCLLGPSGCGKSTTLRMAAGVERLGAGEVWIDGRMVASPDVHLPPEKRGIGMMFQDFALFPHLTAAQNVGFGIKGGDPARVQDLLGRVGLADKGHKYPC